ncbi:MAG: UDP-2,3-diacylglucosamine diphosphatase [Rudaea sp.]|nr:UDP-2,3-diacylglucosamine diphosphatase [Rudaea sp.]
MSALFISDLHLDESRPHIVDLFTRFLADDARKADALYILGDLLESWVGDDDDSALARNVAAALRAVRDNGVPVYFMHGNRDFLLGADYAARAGMELLRDPTIVDLDQPTLLMHGDTLCTDDVDYQKFRTLVRDAGWQRQFLAKPLADRRAFAAQARGESRRHTSAASMEIMDVNTAAVESAMRQYGVRRLVHGHTHRPATHRLNLDGEVAERIVLGDWYEQSSVLQIARVRHFPEEPPQNHS